MIQSGGYTMSKTSYPKIYLEDFSKSIGYTFYLIAEKSNECDVVRTLDFFLSSSVFQEIYNRANPMYLNKSPKQLIECISYDDGFEWYNTKPTGEEIDKYIMEWVGTLLAHFQWEYKIDFKDWLKYFSVRDIYNMYYPLHEASYQVASSKLMENYRYMKRKNKS